MKFKPFPPSLLPRATWQAVSQAIGQAIGQATGRIPWLLAVAGLLAACSSTGLVAVPTATSIAPAETLPPALSPVETATPPPTPSPVPQLTGIQQEAAPTATGIPTPTTTAEAKPSPTDVPASPVVKIPLTGSIANNQAELSGLAWYGDNLILLPQFPDFNTAGGQGFIYALPKAEVISYLDGALNQPLKPRPIPFVAPGLGESIAGFEGFEALAFLGDTVYLTVESRTDGGMLGYLIKGTLSPDLSALTLEASTIMTIAPQTDIENMSEESLFVAGQVVGTIYELNGRGVNASPVVHLFDLELRPLEAAGFPQVPFRITDVTELDQDGRFWAINYFFPGTGEVVMATPESQEGDEDGAGSQLPWEGLGRLVEFQYRPTAITLTGRAPLYLETQLSAIHNWEGLARLDDRGFLLVSDEFPDTVLGFVPFQEAE